MVQANNKNEYRLFAHHEANVHKATLLLNMHGFWPAVPHFNRLRMPFKIMYKKLKSIDIWLRYQAKDFQVLSILQTSEFMVLRFGELC